jgi:hypothetical protein
MLWPMVRRTKPMGAGSPMYGSNISYRRGIHTAARTTTVISYADPLLLPFDSKRYENTGNRRGVLKDGIKGRVLFRAGRSERLSLSVVTRRQCALFPRIYGFDPLSWRHLILWEEEEFTMPSTRSP